MNRVLRAWSPRENLRRLFDARRDEQPALDGVRALAVLWAVAFHALFFGHALAPREVVDGIRQTFIGALSWRGDYGVDAFFVLSGFLIGRLLFDERDATGTVKLGRFYVRRAMRLFPAYWVVLVVCMVCFRRTPAVAPRGNTFVWNLIHLNNFVTVTRQTMAWAWSLAIEEQFYLVFPWVVLALGKLDLRRRISVLSAAVPVGAIVTMGLAAAFGLGLADVDLTPDGDVERWARAFDVIYDKPYTRMGALLIGVVACQLDRTTFVSRMIEWPVASTVGALLAFAAMSWAVLLFADPRVPRAIEIVALGASRTVFALGAGYLMLFALSPHPLGQLLGAALSAGVLRPIARLSYSAYLLNPVCAIALSRAAGAPETPDTGTFVLYGAFLTVVTFTAAVVLHLAIEAPLSRLRPPSGLTTHESC